MTQTPVIVLGMHRSGTSCLTGSLEECGVELGEVNTYTHCNLKGLRENAAFRTLNQAVLTDNGVNWDNPSAALVWSDAHKQARDALIAAFDDAPCWGFKDPRTIFTLEGWLEAAPEARLIGTFRHPVAVAKSLNARNGFELEAGLDLWRRYNERLIELHDRYDVVLIDYDWPLARYEFAVRRFAQDLGLRPPERLEFPDTALRHQEAEQAAPPGELADVHGALTARAEAGAVAQA